MRILLTALIAVAISSCIHSDYLGKSYEPTTNVDLYLDEADVRTDYEVMGEVTLETDAGMDFAVSSEKMQEKVMEVAREKGADGVILGSLEKRMAGESTSTTETSKRTTTSTTEIQEKKTVKARLIKYRKNLPGGTPDGR